MNPISTARDLIIKQDITSFALEIQAMKFEKTIYFDTFDNYAGTVGVPMWTFESFKDGCAVIKDDIHLILTRKTKSKRQRFTIAHELGHICLGHVSDGEEQEQQANQFACELLMPELVVLALQCRLSRSLTADEVGELFGVSKAAAAVRLRQLSRKEIFSAYRKAEIMAKYQELIEKYVRNNRKKLCLTL
jgi:Zn-dependent peptidase ImmA (M78 family)